MRRRTYLCGLGGALSFGLAGCTGEEDEPNEGRDGEQNSDDTPTATSTQKSTGEVIIEETIYTKSRYPEDLSANQRLKITVDVKKGGPLILDIANRDTGESVFQETVETEKQMEFTVKNDGTHYITFQGMDEATIKIVLIDS